MNILIQELCAIYHKRNLLCDKRDSARYKVLHLQNQYNLRKLFKDNKEAELWNKRASAKSSRDRLAKKYKAMALTEIRVLILKEQKKLVDAKIKIMEHTKKYAKRVAYLLEENEIEPVYRYGRMQYLRWTNNPGRAIDPEPKPNLQASDIKKHHDEYLANKAIDKMLKE